MNSKAKGSRNERRSIEIFEAAGYQCTKSGGSLGAWDVIAISPTDFIVCQVKTSSWPGSVEMETLLEFRVPSNCKKLVHRWRPYQRKPDVKEL